LLKGFQLFGRILFSLCLIGFHNSVDPSAK
jgi:hypothetical protein